MVKAVRCLLSSLWRSDTAAPLPSASSLPSEERRPTIARRRRWQKAMTRILAGFARSFVLVMQAMTRILAGFDGSFVVVMFSDIKNIDSRFLALCVVFLSLEMPLLPGLLDHLTCKMRPKALGSSEVSLKRRIAYRADVYLSVHPYAKLHALLFVSALLIGLGGILLYEVSDVSLCEALWRSWTYVADTGNHADQVGFGPRVISVFITCGGMLIFSMMVGLTNQAISESVDSLRMGKSEVIVNDHILILGWSRKLGSLLRQLAIAYQSIGGRVIVILAERDKEVMETDISKLDLDFMGTSVICRSGSPLIMTNLKKALPGLCVSGTCYHHPGSR